MTYESAIQWAVENIPMQQFDNFDDWKEEVERNFFTPELLSSNEFNKMLRDSWIKEMGEIDARTFEDTTQEELDKQKKELEELGITENREQQETEFIIERQQALEQEYIRNQQRQRFIENEIMKSPIIIVQEQPSQQHEPIRREIPQTGKAPELPKPQFQERPSNTNRRSFRERISSGFKSFASRFRRNRDNE